MISKRIDRNSKTDNYRRLAQYIADADHQGEKALMHWCACCWAGEDYDLAIQEVEATQSLNVRSQKSATYHLIISFHPEDEPKLTPEALKDIEQNFSVALGFAEHQRHCGVHKNTNNMHMHVAYNMIHPEKLTRHEPWRDFRTQDRVRRDMEQKYGLVVDRGCELHRPKHERLSQGAARMEAHTGQESFESYVKTRYGQITTALEASANWQGLHEAMTSLGLTLKPRGNGLVIVEMDGKASIKGSSLDRAFSLKRLEAKLGTYETPNERSATATITERYQAAPVHVSPERAGLDEEFRTGLRARKESLSKLYAEEAAELATMSDFWRKKRGELRGLALPRPNRARLLGTAKIREKEERSALKARYRAHREAIKAERPYTNWSAFLRLKANKGNETALSVLRSRKEAVEPEDVAESPQTPGLAERRREIWGHSRQREKTIIASTELRTVAKYSLLAVEKMRRLAALEEADNNATTGASGATDKPPILSGFTHEIDSRGVIIYHLPGGGSIRDTGKAIHFSAWDDAARQAADLYAKARWGQGACLDGNTFHKPLSEEQRRELEALGIRRNTDNDAQQAAQDARLKDMEQSILSRLWKMGLSRKDREEITETAMSYIREADDVETTFAEIEEGLALAREISRSRGMEL